MANNFDFFVGTWTSRQRRLREVLVGNDDWDEFTGLTKCWSVFHGAGNIDEVTFPEKGFGGVTLRLYDKSTDLWSLYWASSSAGLAMPPQVGRFGDDGRGVFLADDVYRGTPVRVSYVWVSHSPDSCRWEQAFSTDGGTTWETNWTADFSRTA